MKKLSNRNLTPKILSILFALVMWIYVMSEINPRTTIDIPNIPVELINVQEIRKQGLVLLGSGDYQINVRVTGRRDEVYKLARDEIHASADLMGYRAGTSNIPVDVSVGGNVEIDYNPKYIKVELEEIVKKQKEVNIIINGRPAEGYVIGSIQYKPNIVWVEGPESRVNAVDRVVAQLELSGDTRNIAVSLPIKPVNSKNVEVMEVNVDVNYVDITLPIDQLKTVNIQPNVDVTAAEGYEIIDVYVVPERISVRGQQEILDPIFLIHTNRVELKNLIENVSIETYLDLPDGVKLLNSDEVKVNVVVQKIVQKNFTIHRNEIVFSNLREGLILDKSNIPELLQVTITAPEGVIETINEKDIKVFANLQELQVAGLYTIEPAVNLPYLLEQKVKETTLIPGKITVRLEMANE